MAAPEPPSRPTGSLVSAPRGLVADSRLMLMAGVASACLLGAAAGAWVGPRDEDLKAREIARSAPRTAPPMAPAPQMRIVMDASALPARPPMEVLPDWARQVEPPEPPPVVAPPPLEPFVSPPMRDAPSLRLVRDDDPPPEPKAEKPRSVKAEKPKPAKVQIAKTEEKPKADKAKAAKKAEQTRLAKAEAAKKKARAEKIELAKAEKARTTKPKSKPEKIVLAKAEPKAKKPEKAKEKPKPVVLAKAEPKPKPAAPKPKSFDVMLAEIRLAEAKPAPPAPAPKVEPPVKVAKVTAKAPRAAPQPSRAQNPWADDDRRLARAYRRAAEAGVPEWRLERQQARWRQARDAAEREAPWAVRRVYAARIAELDDLAGEAAMEWN